MLGSREVDIPAVFLVLVVLPLVVYVFLGKWGEAEMKREKVSLLAQLAAEERIRALETAAPAAVTPFFFSSSNEATVLPFAASSNSGQHLCARCFAVAKTRCSRCKSIRYCSGKCQIIHWRQIRKYECYQSENISSSSSPAAASIGESIHGQTTMEDKEQMDKWGCCKYNRGLLETEALSKFCEKASGCRVDDIIHSNSRSAESVSSEEESSENHNVQSSNGYIFDQHVTISTKNKSQKQQGRHRVVFEPKIKREHLHPPYSVKDGLSVHYSHKAQKPAYHDIEGQNCSEVAEKKGTLKAKNGFYSFGVKDSKSPKSDKTVSGEKSCADKEREGQASEDTRRPSGYYYLNGVVPSKRIIKMMGPRKSAKAAMCNAMEDMSDRYGKIKMLFPYEEFVKLFQYEVYGLSPRGLMNCGNSCYANAVLQCLTCTKPIIAYLLHRSHSKAGCKKYRCLMCELEEHVMMLSERREPISPSGILWHMQSLNCQLGGGNQEDAHEFLRLLITSMQSTCLETLGGERKVNPTLQETTFIQYTFGGRLRSKVQCLRCHHESERYENIMDLTLEIFGWVESLEDALTQFTAPEDLDGDNMYQCGRCAAYVRARKQLSINDAPNILTIVLKRFQEGEYGKISKCIAFPDKLDMIPFMTGMGDVPPLYMLYGVVVHLDMLNASFSGHYISYVKDFEGNWFRIDDTEVQPVSISQVMSEGAYILFYMRSWPRSEESFTGRYMQRRTKTQKPSRSGQSQSRSSSFGAERVSDIGPKSGRGLARKYNGVSSNMEGNFMLLPETYTEPIAEFSDGTSSDRSFFTSSDEASFTSDSARDSFSTVDYADACNIDPMSIFNNLYCQDYPTNTMPFREYMDNIAEAGFISEEKGYVLEPYIPLESGEQQGEYVRQFNDFSPQLPCDSRMWEKTQGWF